MTPKFNITVLVAPLDWGLGHATRCIPIIQYLINNGCKVYIGAEGLQKNLLEKEFPTITILPLKGYRINYSKDKRLFAIKIIQQLPRLIHTISAEHKWLKKVVNEYSIDAVISDNRYGLYSRNIHSVFITHQLKIQAPFKWVERCIQILNYQRINRFSACWVPDEEGTLNIAGRLSHVTKFPRIPVKYLGGISRLEKKTREGFKYDFLAIISGPEPQRSMLEQQIFNDLKDYKGTGLIVRGLPSEGELIASFSAVTVLNHLPAKELENACNESEFIISRSGYTTVMDNLKLQKKSILIATPGQTEQEYLADHLQRQQWALSIQQPSFNLIKALEIAKKFSYNLPLLNMEMYKSVLDEFMEGLRVKP